MSTKNDFAKDNAGKAFVNFAIETTVAYGCHIAGASFPVSTLAPLIVSNTIDKEYKAGEKYVENYNDAKRDGMTDRQASNWASMLDRPMGE